MMALRYRLKLAAVALLTSAVGVVAISQSDLFPFGGPNDTVMSTGDDNYVRITLPRSIPYYDTNYMQVRGQDDGTAGVHR